jgi:S-adenosylmethionine decarboxylase
MEKLNNKDYVTSCLDELPDVLGMKKLCQAQVFFAPESGEKDPGGWSGFVVIAESHISLHTFPKRGFLTADVYSCKNGIDCNFIIDYFKKKFELKEVEDHFIRRGMKYPVGNIN